MLVTQEKSCTKRFKDLIPLDVFKSTSWEEGKEHIFIRCEERLSHENRAMCVTDNGKIITFATEDEVILLTATLTWSMHK